MIATIRTFKIYSLNNLQIANTFLRTFSHHAKSSRLTDFIILFLNCHHLFHPSFQPPYPLATTSLYLFFVHFVTVQHTYIQISFLRSRITESKYLSIDNFGRYCHLVNVLSVYSTTTSYETICFLISSQTLNIVKCSNPCQCHKKN